MDGSVLKRKAASAAPAVTLAAMTPARALRLALAKAGDRELGVPVAAQEIDVAEAVPDTAAEGLPDPGLYLQLDCEGGRGLAVLCPQALGAVIEARTMLRVLATEAAARRATGTDAALVRGWLAAALAGAAALGESCEARLPAATPSGAMLPGSAAVPLYLADRAHRRWRVTLDFGAGAKTGTLWLILPETDAAADPGDPERWRQVLQQGVLGSAARLEAVLARLRLPIEQVTRLASGTVLPLGETTLDEARLVAPDGSTVAVGRLGRSGNRRAVRLRIDPADGRALPWKAGAGPSDSEG